MAKQQQPQPDPQAAANAFRKQAEALAPGILKTVGRLIYDQVFRPLQPVALAAKALSSQASGMQVFNQAVSLLGNTLGATITPVVLLFSAAIGTAAAVIAGQLLPAMTKFAQWMGRQVGENVGGEGDQQPSWLRRLPGYLTDLSGDMAQTLGLLDDRAIAQHEREKAFRRMSPEEQQAELRRQAYERGDILPADGKEEKEKSIGQTFIDFLKGSIRAQEQALSPKPQLNSLIGAAMSAQMAGLNAMSPFEKEQLKQNVDMIGVLTRMEESLRRAETANKSRALGF